MDHKTAASSWIRLAGMASLLLGLIHLAAAPFTLFSGFEKLSIENLFIFLYVFFANGVALIFTGWLILVLARKLKEGQTWAWSFALGAGLFLFISGCGAIISMSGNPFSYLLFFTSLSELIPLWVYRQELRQTTSS